MKILLLNQCFWPDVVATSQQLTAVARRLSEQGHEVTVVAARQGYDDPGLTFPRRERWNGIEVIRVSSLNLGKKTRSVRTVNFVSFLLTSALQMLRLPRHDVVVALTSPPLISWLGSLFTKIKGGRMVFWAMDLNPDEAIAAGWLKQNSLIAKFLSRLLKSSMARAKTIVALDEFMKERIVSKGIDERKIAVIPPARDDNVRFDEEGREAFRRQHHLADKFVVMYAGNHSPCHPLNTLFESANELKSDEAIAFVFAGGGSEFKKVEAFARAHELTNIKCFPYQPQESFSAVLSAADLHVVVMGDPFVGIVHPSKIYNILSIGAPFVFIGPEHSSMGEIVSQIGDPKHAAHVSHGAAIELAKSISEAAKEMSDFKRSFRAPEIHEFDSLPSLVAVIESAHAAVHDDSVIKPVVRTSPGQI